MEVCEQFKNYFPDPEDSSSMVVLHSPLCHFYGECLNLVKVLLPVCFSLLNTSKTSELYSET